MENKQKIKKTYSEDYVGAILEEIRGDFKVFGEGLNDVRRGVERVEDRLGKVEEKVDRIDIRLSGVENRLSGVEEKVDLLIEDMDEIKPQIKNINDKMNEKAEKEVTDNHEKRIFKLEKASQAA